jgi:hypothetical protein
MYRPLNNIRNNGGSGEYVSQAGGSPHIRAAKFATTVNVKTMDSQRWPCRFQ